MVFRRLWSYRALTLSLVRRQYQLRYRQSLVGFAWAVVPPIAGLVVAVVVFNRALGVEAPAGQSYALVALAALTPWTFFANGLNAGIPSIVSSQPMVSRMAFPRAVLPLSVIGTCLIDLSISSLGFVVFAVAIGAGIPLTALWFPVLLIVEILLIVGVTLFGSALNVFARDIRLAVPLLTQFWLFLTPVMYPLDSVPPNLRGFYLANPMTGIVESFRDVLVNATAPDLSLLAPALIGSAVFLLLGTWYFTSTESRFADVV